MADDAPDYRELMAQLEAAFASEQPRGLSEFKGPMTARPEVSGEQALVPKAWANEQAESRSGGVNVSMGPFSGGARVTADESGRPVNVGLSANAGPASYQYGRAPAHGAPGQHTFNLNLDPADVGARLQAILAQGPGGQRSYGVGTGGDGWGVQVMHDPQRRATQISGGMQRRFAEGGSVPSLRERLLSMLKGDDYQSTGDKVVNDGEVNWGSSDSAADFFRADKARMEMERRASESESRPAPSRVIESRPLPPPERRQAAPEVPPAQRTIPGAQPPLPSGGFMPLRPNRPSEASVQPVAYDSNESPEALRAMASRYAADEKPEALRAIEKATDQLNIRDISHIAQYRGSAMEEPEAVVFHHTAGRGTPEGVVNTLNNRVDPFTGRKMILGVHYIIDRDGSVHAALPPGTTGAHVLTNQERNLGNQNTIGVEVIAKDNDDVTPEQVAAGKLLHAYLSSGRKKPLEVFGHGELNPGHKLPNEGLAVVNPIRNRFKIDAARGYAEGGEVDCGCAPGYAGGGPFDEDTYGPSNIEERRARLEERLAAERVATAQYPGDELEAPKGYITPAKAVRWVDTDTGPMAVDAEGNSLPLIQQPGLLPLYRDPTIDSVRTAMPRMLDITGDMMGAPLGIATLGLSHAVGPTVRAGETMLGMAVKPKGGNWLANSVEAETQGLKNRDIMEALRAPADMPPPNHAVTDSINNWVDKKLNKYIRNEMATPEDPIRLLAEQGTLHVNPENLYPTFRNQPNQQLLAQSREAKVWEDLADRSLKSDSAKERIAQGLKEENPWLEKVSPDTPVYGIKDSAPYFELNRDLGFDHLVDELRNAVRHDSDLPANLRLTPEKLDKVSVPQAVELVSKINKWREEAAGRALAKNATNDATHLVKEYPETGYKWVELKPPTAVSEEVLSSLSAKERELFNHYVESGDNPYEALQAVTGAYDNPALKAALKYEGDMMGHCVGGYCGDVESGQSRIFSLRDSKGRPHVTIETGRNMMLEGVGNAINAIEPGLWEKMVKKGNHLDHNAWLKENRPDVYTELNKESVIQVKGKGNGAPKEEYLPFVQDFIKAGEWKDIYDLRNTGLYQVKPGQRLPGSTQEIAPGLYSLEELKDMAVKSKMPDDMRDMWMSKLKFHGEFAQGGSVQGSGATEAADLDTLYQKYADPGYATGGLVSPQATANDNLVYDPDEIDAIAAQIRGVN